MNPIGALNAYQSQHQFSEEKINELFLSSDFKSPILRKKYYHLAKKISEIPDFVDIAEALLTSENPRKINPQAFLQIWHAVIHSLPQLAPGFEKNLRIYLKHVFQSLLHQYEYKKCNSSMWITTCIRNLQSEESFQLILPHKTAWGETLEHVVIYQKNDDHTFNIKFFHAKKDCWREQGGLQALGYEKVISMRYYSRVPLQDLLGPKFKSRSSIHAKSLLIAAQDSSSPANALISVFAPLNSYLTEPDFPVHLAKVEHAHALKGMHAFLYACIAEKASFEEVLEKYKALMCIFRLVLSIAVMKTFSKTSAEKLNSNIGMLAEASCTTARHLNKNRDNRWIEPLYEAAVGTLEQLKEYAEKLLHEAIPPDNSVKNKKIAENQDRLMQMGLEASGLLLETLYVPFVEKKEAKYALNDLLKIKVPPNHPEEFIFWLSEAQEKLMEIGNTYPDMVIPALNSVISTLELPQTDSVWLIMEKPNRRKGLKIICMFVEHLTEQAFRQNVRFSLDVQNNGARLLLIAQTLAESLDNKKILCGFKPVLTGYKKLTKSPYFQCTTFSAWQQRQAILSFVDKGDLSERKPALVFSHKDRVPFEKTQDGIFAATFLNAYPDVSNKIQNQLKKIRQRKDLQGIRTIVPEQLFLAELLNIKIQNVMDHSLDLENENIYPLSCLMQVAMHVHLLSSMFAIHQFGYENVVTFQQGLSFDLTYAKKQKFRSDFHITRIRKKNHFDLIQRNLLPQEKRIENQNETLKRFVLCEEEKSEEMFPFEEAASEPNLTVLQLLSKGKSQFLPSHDSQARLSFVNYLFKIFIAKDGKESFLVYDEMLKFPQVFNCLLNDFLQSTKMITKNLEHGSINEHHESIISVCLCLFSMAQTISCHPVIKTLEQYIDDLENKLKLGLENLNEKLHVQLSNRFKILLLKIIDARSSLEINWPRYFKWGSQLQEQLEQKETPQLWWNTMRWKMAQHFQEMKVLNAEVEYIDEENFDVLSMSTGRGKWQSIPKSILKNTEFIRLFSDRISFWKVDEERNQITFSDPLTDKYLLTDPENFPSTLYRWIDEIWHVYISDQEVVKCLHVPKAIRQESVWWLNPHTLEAKGYYKSQPTSLWLERKEDGIIIFKDGLEKGMRLELVEDDENSLSQLEINTGIFGLHYYSYHARFVMGNLIDFRDFLTFPNIHMAHGGPLIFERQGNEFYERGNLDRKLGESLYSPSTYYAVHHTTHKPTALKVYAIQVKKIMKETVREEEETMLILPFQRHVSDVHSHRVHALTQKMSLDAISYLNFLEVIEITVGSHGFCPELPTETFFAAYLSLIGKDYHAAARFLKKVRPNYRLDDKDRQIFKWLIECKEDSQDYSASAAAIKLLAYKILGDQGLSISGEINPKVMPDASLESVYLDYLNHISSVPGPLKLSIDVEVWIMKQGFQYFPPIKDHLKLWDSRKKDLLNDFKTFQIFNLPESSRISVLDKWQNSIIFEELGLIEIPQGLVLGIIDEEEQPLIPGNPYPLSSFGFHFHILSTQEISEQDKWELIYALETVILPDFIKAALKLAFQKGQEFPLPKLDKKDRNDNCLIVHDWFKKHVLPFFIKPHKKEIAQITFYNVEAHDEMRFANDVGNQEYAQKILKVMHEVKKASPAQLMKTLQASFTGHIEPIISFIEIECPFIGIDETDDEFKKELKFYAKEWEIGESLQKQAYRYSIPNIDKIKEFEKFLHIYSNEINLNVLQRDILRLLNRRPMNSSLQAQVRLAEVKENKVQMTIDDAFRTIFLQDYAQKLAFLKTYNPFLVEEDLDLLNTCLQKYLEWSICDKLLGQIKDKLGFILEILEKDGLHWNENPTVQQLWQEIGELLNPFDKYSDDPQIHMETLLFEYLSGFRIREAQANILHTLVQKIFAKDPKDCDFAIVFQLIMAGGKTSVILAMMAKWAARNGQACIFIAYHSQHASLKVNLVNTQFERLNQDVIDLDFNRADLASIKVLNYINMQLNAAHEKGHVLLIKAHFIIILRLEFITQIKALTNPQNFDLFNLDRIHELANILAFLKNKKKCLHLGDEVDSIFNMLDDVTFPSGSSVVVTKSSLDLIQQVYVILSTCPDISSLLNLKNDDQSLVDKKKLLDKIFPTLVDQLIQDYPPLSSLIPPKKNYLDIRESLKEYILGKIDARLSDGISIANDELFFDALEIFREKPRQRAKRHLAFLRHLYSQKEQPSESVYYSLSAAALAKELCTEILSITLGKGYNHNYGFTDDGKLIPYLGVDTPNQTEFGNIYVTVCCYFQAALQRGVNEHQLKKYQEKLREASFYYSELYHCDPEKSSEAVHFKTLTGLELHQGLSEKDLKRSVNEINQDPQRCLDFYAEFSSLHLRYHTSFLNCGPIALAYMLGQFVGCSALLWNKEAFARKIADNCISQVGTEGRILVKFAQDLADKKSFLSLIDHPTPHAILTAVLEKRETHAPKYLRGLIDACGMLKRYTNRACAEEILKFKPLESEIEAVVFLNKVGAKEAFSILIRGNDKIFPLKKTNRKEIEKHGVHLDHVFVYFDELRALGSDVPMKADGIAAMTFDPLSTTMGTVSQALLRSRCFFNRQVVDAIILKKAVEGFTNYTDDSPLTCLNVKNFFYHAIRNQVELKKTQLLRSAFEQIREIYCSEIIKKLIHAFVEVDKEINYKSLELFKAAEWLFYRTFKDDPITLFLDLHKEVQADKVVQGYLDNIHSRFQKTCIQYFEESEINSINQATREVTEWSKDNLTWKVLNTNSGVHLEKQILVEKQHDNQMEVNIEIQKEMQKELQKYAVQVDAPAAPFILWGKLNDPPQSFMDYKTPDLISFRRFLKRVPYEAPYHRIFPKDLYLTENLARSHAIDLPVFHKAQKNAYHVLLVKNQNIYQTLFIDLKEAVFWRAQIQKYPLNDCWLCDLDGHLLNEGKIIPSDALVTLKRAQWWGHFFNGNASYLRAHPFLVQQEFKNENYELKYRYLILKAANDPLQTKILTIDPILAEKPLTSPVFQYNDKIEEGKLFEEIENLEGDRLNQLPFHFARFFSSKQIPLLNRAGYFTYLPSEKFGDITTKQVALIPNYRLQYLCHPEQVAEIAPEKIFWLKGKALEYLPEKYIGRINPEVFPQLTYSQQKKYQRAKIQAMGLEAFARNIQPFMAFDVLPECVEFITDECLPFLQTSKQLARVSSDKYHLLKARQFHHLPPKHWSLLQLEDYQKYCTEEKIPHEAQTLIQQMNVDWANAVDPRLAQFFSDDQVRKISQPKPIQYLNAHQLQWLKADLAKYLEPSQIAELSDLHRHLIATFNDPKIVMRLSNKGVKELSIHQVRRLDKKKIIEFIPYLNEMTLRSVEMGIFAEVEELTTEVRLKLTSLQIQCFLGGQKNRKSDLEKIIKEMTVAQWQGMDPIFIEAFFAEQPKNVIQYVPKTHTHLLRHEALLKWYGVDNQESKIMDVIAGVSSLICYPLILLSVLLLRLFANQKNASWFKTWRSMVFSPLRLLSRQNYYRLISNTNPRTSQQTTNYTKNEKQDAHDHFVA